MLKPGEPAKLVWIMWWVGLSAFVATFFEGRVSAKIDRVAAREELVASYAGNDGLTLSKTLAAATEQNKAFRAAGERVKLRLDVLADSRATGWLVTLVHDLARTHGCTVGDVGITPRAVEPKESGLTWLRSVAHLRGPYPALRAFVAALAASPPGQATGGVAIRQLSLTRADKDTGVQLECHFEVLAR